MQKARVTVQIRKGATKVPGPVRFQTGRGQSNQCPASRCGFSPLLVS